ncbi:MAG: hypothetical protein IBX47_11130 [Desulfuromonadales bacterium]|nr:hypothetical protein [Desulfuromonadales bacterium]
MNPELWEAICTQCGDCCFEKVIDVHGEIYHTRIACRYLDINTRLCKVYHKRFETGEECIRLTPEIVKEVNWLSDSCAYVKLLRGAKDKPGKKAAQ